MVERLRKAECISRPIGCISRPVGDKRCPDRVALLSGRKLDPEIVVQCPD